MKENSCVYFSQINQSEDYLKIGKFTIEATKDGMKQILYYNNKKYERELITTNEKYTELDSDFNNEEIPEVLRDIISWYEPDIQLIISFFNNN